MFSRFARHSTGKFPTTGTKRKAGRRRSKSSGIELRAEQLESRCMLAVTTTFIGGVLTFTGDAADDRIVIETDLGPDSIRFDDGTGLGAQRLQGVNEVIFNAGGGDDTLIVSNPDDNIFAPANGITFNGGGQTSAYPYDVNAPGDLLIVGGGNAVTQYDGFWDITGTDSGNLTYTLGGQSLAFNLVGTENIYDLFITTGDFDTDVTNGDDTINILGGPDIGDIDTFTQGPVVLDGSDREDHGDFAGASSFAVSQNIDGLAWSMELDTTGWTANDTTVPHIALVATGDGTHDFYEFTIANAGDTGTFDVDNSNVDTKLFLFDSAGDLLAVNDNIGALDPGSVFLTDSFIQHTFAAAGTYYLGVGAHDSTSPGSGQITGPAPGVGLGYQLNISIENHALVSPIFQFDLESEPNDQVSAAANVGGWQYIEQIVDFTLSQVFNDDAVPGNDILAIGARGGPALDAINSVASELGVNVTHVSGEAAIGSAPTPAFNEYTATDISGSFNFEDISGSGTAVTLADNEVSGPIPAGFSFDFYADVEDTFFISSNGWIATEGTVNSNPFSTFFPVPEPGAPNGAIFGWWSDLDPSQGGTIHYETLGTSGSQRFVVQYTGVPHADGTAPATFQIKVFEDTGFIEVHHQTAPTTAAPVDYVVGVENQNGSNGTEYVRQQTDLPDNSAVQFRPDGAFVPATAGVAKSIDFNDYRMIYVPTNANQFFDNDAFGMGNDPRNSGITGRDLDALWFHRSDIIDFVRNGGGVVSLTDSETPASNGSYAWLAIPDPYEITDFAGEGIGDPDDPNELRLTVAAIDAGLNVTGGELSNGIPYHNTFDGPEGFNRLDPWVLDRGVDGINDGPLVDNEPQGDDRIISIGQGGIRGQIEGSVTTEINGDDGSSFEFPRILLAPREGQITVTALDGDDFITVTTAAGFEDDINILGGLTIHGFDGINTDSLHNNDTLIVTDAGDPTGDIVQVSTNPAPGDADHNAEYPVGNFVTGLASFLIDYSDIQILEVTATAGRDAIEIAFLSDLGPFEATINGFEGSDVFGAINLDGGDRDLPGWDFDNVKEVLPSLYTDILLNGDNPTFGTFDPPTDPGDHVNFDIREATAPVIIDTMGADDGTGNPDGIGRVISQSHRLLRFTTMESIEVTVPEQDDPDQDSTIPDIEIGDLYVRGTENSDRIIFWHPLSGYEVNINNVVYGKFFPNRRYLAYGRGGNDTLISYGNDRTLLESELHGEDGNDYLASEEGNDTLVGGPGNDYLQSEGGDDEIHGDEGNDFLDGHGGNDLLFGGEGNDRIVGREGDDTILGGSGNDELFGQLGDDLIRGEQGMDLIRGGFGHDILLGGSESDLIDGESGNDILIGGVSADSLIGSYGNDVLIGGATIFDPDDTTNPNEGEPIDDQDNPYDNSVHNILFDIRDRWAFQGLLTNIATFQGGYVGTRTGQNIIFDNTTILDDDAVDFLSGRKDENLYLSFGSDLVDLDDNAGEVNTEL